MTLEMWGEFSRNLVRLKTISRMQGIQKKLVSRAQEIKKELASRVQETQMEQV